MGTELIGVTVGEAKVSVMIGLGIVGAGLWKSREAQVDDWSVWDKDERGQKVVEVLLRWNIQEETHANGSEGLLGASVGPM
jgi:hypothetical protein